MIWLLMIALAALLYLAYQFFALVFGLGSTVNAIETAIDKPAAEPKAPAKPERSEPTEWR